MAMNLPLIRIKWNWSILYELHFECKMMETLTILQTVFRSCFILFFIFVKIQISISSIVMWIYADIDFCLHLDDTSLFWDIIKDHHKKHNSLKKMLNVRGARTSDYHHSEEIWMNMHDDANLAWSAISNLNIGNFWQIPLIEQLSFDCRHDKWNIIAAFMYWLIENREESNMCAHCLWLILIVVYVFFFFKVLIVKFQLEYHCANTYVH